MRVLVTGATGFVGGRLLPALCEAGHDVRALVRDPAGYDGPEEVTLVTGDLLEPGSFDAALDGVEVAYYLVHSMDAGAGFADRDRRAAQNFVTAANEAGIERIVYLGGLGEEREQLSKHLRSRREIEQVLAKADAAVTTLRAAIIIGKGSASFDMVQQLATRLPVMITPRWVTTDCQPIAISDVVAYLVGVLETPATAGETFEIGGPDVVTYRELLTRTAEIITGRRAVIFSVPMLSPSLSAYWVDLVTDVPRSVARPLILGLKNPVVVTDDSIREHLPIELTPFDVAIARAVENPAKQPTVKTERQHQATPAVSEER